MSNSVSYPETTLNLTPGEKDEMVKLGILSPNEDLRSFKMPDFHNERPPIAKKAVHAPNVLNEAFEYGRPSSFSRATRMEFGDYSVVLISGTASVNEEGKAEHIGNFRAQTWRTFRNISELLASENMSWHDIVRTTCYLRDIERDYKDFNEVRTQFYDWLKLNPLPASTGIQATLCWDTLLVEIEAIAVCKNV
ncbi:MAG TPA: Rid family hydrolase [Balneolaceae bacterium]|nr:Rid family hydrolase [Balneolaceae bacterium]